MPRDELSGKMHFKSSEYIQSKLHSAPSPSSQPISDGPAYIQVYLETHFNFTYKCVAVSDVRICSRMWFRLPMCPVLLQKRLLLKSPLWLCHQTPRNMWFVFLLFSQEADSWEIIEGLKIGQTNVQRPDKHEGFMLKKRKWPLKGWHKVPFSSYSSWDHLRQ